MAPFAEDDYEEVAARLGRLLAGWGWGCWDAAWSVRTSGGITQARQRLENIERRGGLNQRGRP
jgi:hypothetical protein